MKKNMYAGVALLGLLMSITGCSYNNPLEMEQYKKTIYIVGANQSNNEGLAVVDLPYKATDATSADTYISLATGGSQTIDRAITARVAEAGSETVDKYNSMYLYKDTDIKYRMLNTTLYSIADLAVQIKAGDTYGRMPITVKTAGLHCDSLYALTFKIASVSDESYVSIRNTDSVLMFSFNLYNDYSGVYQETGRYYKYAATTADTVALSLTRTLKAVNYNTVRLYHLATTESISNVPANGVSIKVNTDNTLSVSPWGTLEITAGGGTYNATAGLFDIWYNYKVSGVVYQFKGQFTKSGS